MRGKAGILAGLILVFLPATALELSGRFSTGFTWSPASWVAQSTLGLRLSLSTWEIQSLSTLQGLALAQETLTVSGSLGNLRIQAGVVLKPVSWPRWGTWAVQDLQVVGSFVTFELALGNVRFKLTLQAGPAEP